MVRPPRGGVEAHRIAGCRQRPPTRTHALLPECENVPVPFSRFRRRGGRSGQLASAVRAARGALFDLLKAERAGGRDHLDLDLFTVLANDFARQALRQARPQALRLVERLHDDEDDHGDDKEVDDGADERAEVDATLGARDRDGQVGDRL